MYKYFFLQFELLLDYWLFVYLYPILIFFIPVPNPVPQLLITSTTSTSVGLAWTEPDGPVGTYLIKVFDEDDQPVGLPIEVNPNGPLEYVVTGLIPDSEYHFEILNEGSEGTTSIGTYATAETNEDGK